MTENHILLHFLLSVVRTHFGKLVVILYGNVFYSPEVIIISWLNGQEDIREALALLPSYLVTARTYAVRCRRAIFG